jgi:hypothetical protein
LRKRGYPRLDWGNKVQKSSNVGPECPTPKDEQLVFLLNLESWRKRLSYGERWWVEGDSVLIV